MGTPYFTDHSPTKNSTGNSVATNIVFRINPVGDAIDTNTLTVGIEGGYAIVDGVIIPGYTGAITAEPSGAYLVTINPDVNFAFGQVVNISTSVFSSSSGSACYSNFSQRSTNGIIPVDVEYNDLTASTYAVLSGLTKKVAVYNEDLEFVSYVGESHMTSPARLCVYPLIGSLYVIDTVTHKVYIYDSSMNYVSEFGGMGSTLGKFMFGYGAGIASDGNYVYVSDTFRIQRFDWDGANPVLCADYTTSGRMFVGDIYVDVDRIYAMYTNLTPLPKDTQLVMFDRTSPFAETGTFEISSSPGAAYDISVDHAYGGGTERIYVPMFLENKINVYDTSGSLVCSWGTCDVSGLEGTICGPMGVHFYTGHINPHKVTVANTGNTWIDEWTPFTGASEEWYFTCEGLVPLTSATATVPWEITVCSLGEREIFILGEVSIVPNSAPDDAVLLDSRVRGGGIREEFLLEAIKHQPEVKWYYDVGNFDGEEFPSQEVIVLRLPRSLTDGSGPYTFTEDEVRDIAVRHMGFGVYPLIVYYDDAGEEL